MTTNLFNGVIPEQKKINIKFGESLVSQSPTLYEYVSIHIYKIIIIILLLICLVISNQISYNISSSSGP